MRENLDAIKRLVAFCLTLLLIGTTVWDDVFVIADTENPCTEFVDEYSYSEDGTLEPGQYPDGLCDNCGRDEASHIYADEEETEDYDEYTDYSYEENLDYSMGTEDETVPSNDVQSQESPEYTDNTETIPTTDEAITGDTTPVVEPGQEPQIEPEITPEETVIPDEEKTQEEIDREKAAEEEREREEKEKAEQEKAEQEAKEKEEKEKAEQEKKENCQHEWEYTSNEDGTHMKKCPNCDEEIKEECDYDEDGKCKNCGYVKTDEEKVCEHEWEYTAKNDGTHVKKCTKCEVEETENCEYGDDGLCKYCGAPNMTLEYQSYSKEFGSTTVTISGMMPSHSKVTIFKAGVKVAENIINDKLEDETFKAYEAYNINIYDASGKKYQPEDEGESVKVSFTGVDELEKANQDDVTVYRIEDDYEITEIESEVVGEDVYIDAEHFTTYAVGTTASGNYITFMKTLVEGFGYVGTNNHDSTKPYLKVNQVRFRLYADTAGTYSFTATVYKDLESESEPDSGTAVATASSSITISNPGWATITINLNDITGQDRYITYGNKYGVVVVPGESPSNQFNIGYGSDSTVSRVKVGTWETIEQDGIFIEKFNTTSSSDYNIELSATAGENTATITAINGPDPSSGVSSTTKLNPYADGKFLYSKGDTGIFEATLSDGSTDRVITWTSSASEVLEVNSSTGAFTAKEAGTSTVTATYVNKLGSQTKTIEVKVIRFEIGGVDPNGSNAPKETPYEGVAIQPNIQGFEDSTQSHAIGVTAAFDNNVNVAYENDAVATKAHVIIGYQAGGTSGTVFSFNRYFKITPLALQSAAFTNATTLTVSNGTVTSITNIDPETAVYTANTKPVFGTDFTASIQSTTTSTAGKTYVVNLTGKGNFTGTASWTKIDTSDVGITVELSDNSALNSCYYTGQAVTLSSSWDEVVFRNSEGNTIDYINSTTADYVITDKGGTTVSNINAGQKTLTFTVKDGYGLAGAKFSVDFWIYKADLSRATVNWVKNEFDHDGEEHKPVAPTHFTVSFKANATAEAVTLDTTEYTVAYTGDYVNVTGVTNIPAIVLTGADKNFSSDTYLSAQYKIVANYQHDLVVRIQSGNVNYDGNAANNYVIPYNMTYTGASGTPNIIIYMSGKTYTKGVDYNLAVVDEGATTLSPNVGTKEVKITLLSTGAFKVDTVITAKYTVVQRSMTVSMIDTTKVTAKTYTGMTIDMITAEPSGTDATVPVSTNYDVKVSYNGKILKRNTDYTLTCENNINAGQATFYVEGKGNFKGTVISSNYGFTINQAELSITDATKALASLVGDSTKPYTGNPFTPEVVVKITTGSTTKTIDRVDPSDPTKVNYKLDYGENISVGNKQVTITGSNNLKGSVTLPFVITSNTTEFSKITIMTDYTALPITAAWTPETGSDGTVTRSYTCDAVPITYSGIAFTGSVGVYVGTTKLEYGKDYRYAYVNTVDAKDYDLTDSSTRQNSPQLQIIGYGNYAKNNATVFLNVDPLDITADGVTFNATGTFDYSWTGNPIEIADLAVKVNSKDLTKGDTTTGDYYVTYESDPKPKNAGKHTITITGRGNYTGSKTQDYHIGNDISSAYVTLYGQYWVNDKFMDKTILSQLTEYHGTRETSLTDTVRYRGKDAAPKVTLYATEGSTEALKAMTEGGTGYDYILTMTPTAGFDGYISRKAGDETGTNFNIVEVKIDADNGQTGYYGTYKFYFAIYPQDVSKIKADGILVGMEYPDLSSKPYSGAEQTIVPNAYFYNGNGNSKYTLNENGAKDIIPEAYNIGPDVSTSVLETTLTGIGNFTGEVTYKSEVTKGNVNIFRTAPQQGETNEQFIAATTADGTATYVTDFDLNDTTKDWYIDKYTYNGKSQVPNILLTSIDPEHAGAKGALTLKEGIDYRIKIVDDVKYAAATTEEAKKAAEDTTCVGKKTITITIDATTNTNFQPQVITLHYEIVTNSIASYVGTLSDIEYVGVDLTPTQIKAYIPNTTTISLKKTATSETELVYGTDYVIVEDTTELVKIQKQTGYEGVSSIRGTNNRPSYGTEDWIFVKGLGTYSGYKQIFFNTVLDLGSTWANVTLTSPSYNLNATGATTEKIVPKIEYRTVANHDVYADLDLTSISGGLTVDNYTISRDRDKLPGPDPSIAVNGQYACKGKATQVRYVNGTTTAVVYFLADLSNYGPTDITFADGTTYPYTGYAVEVEAIGDVLSGATYAKTAQDTGDYTIIYTQDPSNLTNKDAVDVGLWYAVVKATADASNPSKYFIPNSNTGAQLTFRIKYDLADAVVTFVNPNDTTQTITSTDYTGQPFKLYTTKPYNSDTSKRGNTKVRIKIKNKPESEWKLIYDERSELPSNDYFEITPDSVTTKGEHEVTVKVKNSQTDYAYGEQTGIFKITNVSIRSKGIFKLYDPDNPTVEKYNYTYIGSGITPVVKGKLTDGTELKENVDFIVSYNENTNVGTDTAYVTITGIGSYACDPFTPETNTTTGQKGRFSIEKLNMSDNPHVVVEVDEATYSGFYIDPKATSKQNVELKPSYAVYYVDETKGIKNKLQEQTSETTTGDWKVASWENNTIAAYKDAVDVSKRPTLTVTADGTASGNTTGQTKGYFTINMLNLNSGNISIDQDSHEFTGSEIDISDIVKISTTYTNASGEEVKVPLTIKGYPDIADTLCDYTVTITKGNQNYNDGKVIERGTYSITISGMNSCTSSITKYFTITPRNLEDHYHYYYDNGETPGWNGTWTYEKANKRYVTKGKANGVDEDITIYVSDVETVDTAGVTPEVVVIDSGRADKTSYTLLAKDYGVTADRNKAAASAGWSKSKTTDEQGGFHAEIASDSPYITITGSGDYSGSIKVPFNIGKNIINEGLTIKYTVPGYEEPRDYNEEYDNPSTPKAAWQYTYNGTPQKPTISVYNSKGTKLVQGKAYKVTYTNAEGDEDSAINAGWKNVIITGIGDYCGSMSQMYSINRKAITANGGPYTNEDVMKTTNGELTFAMTGSTVARFSSGTLKTYLVDTGLMNATQAAKFNNYFFAVYNGGEIKPKVTVIDNTLGAAGKTSGTIGSSDLNFEYKNHDIVSQFTKGEDGSVTLTRYGEITISFTGTGEKNFGDGNYYVSTGSASYVIEYIIVQHNIESDFTVEFADNGLNGPNQDYDKGKNKEPDVKVSNGSQTLVQGTDYEKVYSEDHWKPGKHTVTVNGLGNYRGSKSLEYTITATLDDALAGYYDENKLFVEDIPVQQYTGTSITTGQPEIVLILPKQNDQLVDFKLEYGVNYQATGSSSTDGYITDGTVIYSGLPGGYFMGTPTKQVDYDVEFDPSKVYATNYESSYEFTGYSIIPDFQLSISTASIVEPILYYRNDDRSKETTDFTTITGEDGKITAVINYAVGNKTGTVEADYKILPRNLANCTYAYETKQRYTGFAVTPALKAMIESTDIKTGKVNEPYVLDEFNGTAGDYAIDYGNYIYSLIDDDAQMVLTDKSDRVTGTKTLTYTIRLQDIANLHVTENTGDSLTVEWVRDLYSDGTILELQKGGETIAISKVAGKEQKHVFPDLQSSTEYTILARAYANVGDGVTIYSHEDSSTSATTDIATNDIKVTSTSPGKATVSWKTDGTVKYYYIYRAGNETDEGTLVAIIPASSGSFTNSKLVSKVTYYYHTDGYAFVNGELQKVNTSKPVKITVK